MPETYELARLLTFLRDELHARTSGSRSWSARLPIEVVRLLRELDRRLCDYDNDASDNRDHVYWNCVASAREAYREETRLGFEGSEEAVEASVIDVIFARFLEKVRSGIRRATLLNKGLPPTYFIFHVESYDQVLCSDGTPDVDPENRPYIVVHRFRPEVLSPFLEGAVKALRYAAPDGGARDMFGASAKAPFSTRN